MRFKDYMETPAVPGAAPAAPAGPAPVSQPSAPGQQGQQQGPQQQKLPPGTESQDWYKQLVKSGMPPEWQQHFIQQQITSGGQVPSTGQMMMKNLGQQAMGKMMGNNPFGET